MKRFFSPPSPSINGSPVCPGSQAPRAGGAAVRSGPAFSLIELLVAAAVFMLLIALLLGMTGQASDMWQKTDNLKLRQQAARLVFERIGRDLEGTMFPLIPGTQEGYQFLVNPASVDNSLKNPEAAFWQTTLGGDTEQGDVGEVGYFLRWATGTNGVRSEFCRIAVPPTATNFILNNPLNWMTAEKIDTHAPSTSDPASTNYLKGIISENVIGFWITLYSGTNTLPIPYDSRATSALPNLAEVSLALMDTRHFQRLTTPSEITNLYSQPTPEAFAAALPDKLKGGVQIFTTRIRLESTK